MKRSTLLLLLFLLLTTAARAAVGDSLTRIVIRTTKGDIRAVLFNDTPLHRDNFLQKVRAHGYDSLLFHRVIPGFVIQAGDTASRHALPGQPLGDSPESRTIPAEIRFPTHYHRMGAIGMAREDDSVNPGRASSEWQFYIVGGQPYTDDALAAVQERLDSVCAGRVRLGPRLREDYRTLGGAPHLDGQYTIFGEVTEGFDVLDSLQFVPRDAADRPIEDERIITIRVEE